MSQWKAMFRFHHSFLLTRGRFFCTKPIYIMEGTTCTWDTVPRTLPYSPPSGVWGSALGYLVAKLQDGRSISSVFKENLETWHKNKRLYILKKIYLDKRRLFIQINFINNTSTYTTCTMMYDTLVIRTSKTSTTTCLHCRLLAVWGYTQ